MAINGPFTLMIWRFTRDKIVKFHSSVADSSPGSPGFTGAGKRAGRRPGASEGWNRRSPSNLTGAWFVVGFLVVYEWFVVGLLLVCCCRVVGILFLTSSCVYLPALAAAPFSSALSAGSKQVGILPNVSQFLLPLVISYPFLFLLTLLQAFGGSGRRICLLKYMNT